MAVNSGSVSNCSVSGKKDVAKSPQKKNGSNSQDNALPSSPSKRNKSPGIRVVGGRIYDSVNGKTCHQCRQKTRDFVAACKSQRNNKLCPIMFCHKCLLNRYGEKAEEVAALGEWSCPRCRGICNCSICMKKRGHQPTGILINRVKAVGYSSVSEMLLKGEELLHHEKNVASPKKEVVASPKKRGKENSFDGKVDPNLQNLADKKSKMDEVYKGNKDDNTSFKITSKSPDNKKWKQECNDHMHDCNKKQPGDKKNVPLYSDKSKKMKRARVDEVKNKKNDGKNLKGTNTHDEKKPKKSKKNELQIDDSKKSHATLARRTSPRKMTVSSKMPNGGAKLDIGFDPDKYVNDRMLFPGKNIVKPLENYLVKEDGANNPSDKVVSRPIADLYAEVPLPMGTELNGVAKIDIRPEDVGSALQFLEFCAVFGKILDVKKGLPECVLRDLLHGRTGRIGKFSVTVQFHIHLLSILQTDQGEECEELSPSNGKRSWFHALKKHFSESKRVLAAQGLDSLEKAVDYETLEASEKLRLLNVLCDEVLGTEKLRAWMDDQSTELAEKIKEAKHKVATARDEEKSLKQKMKDDVAKAIMAKHGAPLSISEHESIVSQIKHKMKEAQAKLLESKGMLLENIWTCDAVRINPVFVGRGGNAYWKLNCYGNSDILRQNFGEVEVFTSNEKWFVLDDEGKQALEKHVSSWRQILLLSELIPNQSLFGPP